MIQLVVLTCAMQSFLPLTARMIAKGVRLKSC